MNSAETQQAVQEEVNNRMAKAQAEIAEKYARGQGGVETSVNAPTGSVYKEKYERESKARKQKQVECKATDNAMDEYTTTARNEEGDEDEDDGDMEDDYELRRIKQQRMKQLKEAHNQKLENLGKGHGQYREILQDEFIKEMTGSMKVICHFYHQDFPRCKIMHHHLEKLAQRHIESKFVKIDANKAPFFVEKLRIRTMPTVVIFNDGVAVDKIVGFEELAADMPEGKEDEWPTIVLARLLAAKNNAINNSAIVDDDEVEATMKLKMDAMRKNALVGMHTFDDDDDDFDLDN